MFDAAFSDTATGRVIHRNREWFNVPVGSVTVSADGKYLAVTCWTDKAILWDLKAGFRCRP
jgi:hypothetical protein